MAHNALHELDPTASLISSPATPTSLLFLKHIRFLLVLGAFHWLPVAIQISYYLSWGHFSPAPPCWTYPSSFLLRETPQLPSIEAPHQSLQHSVALLQDRFYYVGWFFFCCCSPHQNASSTSRDFASVLFLLQLYSPEPKMPRHRIGP